MAIDDNDPTAQPEQHNTNPGTPADNPHNPLDLTDGERTALVGILTFMGVIIALGGIGNLLVILAVVLKKKLQTVSNLFVVNLSICDFMFVTLVLPVNMYTYLADGWLIHPLICKFVGFLGYTLTGTTIMTITLIAWNRYRLVVSVSSYKQMFQPRNMAIMLAGSWLIPIICLQPAIFEVWGRFGFVPLLSSCNLDLDSSSQSFKIFLLIVRAAIPCGLIIYFYSSIYANTRASHQRLHHAACSTTSLMLQQSQRREMRLTRMMGGIFLVFMLSYFPCTVSSLIDWSKLLSKSFHMFCQTSVFLGSAINPLLYGFMNEQFRKAYYEIITCGLMYGRCKKCAKTVHDHSRKVAREDSTENHTYHNTDNQEVNTEIHHDGLVSSWSTAQQQLHSQEEETLYYAYQENSDDNDELPDHKARVSTEKVPPSVAHSRTNSINFSSNCDISQRDVSTSLLKSSESDSKLATLQDVHSPKQSYI
ncbi:G-protein coupled receptor moody [Aplysia californica]|uniref:G-protein coupled receptor moody n=1 Tax=Aplysia californica TaxID=6500 RepID=A0ABM0K9Z1_APLCA|nr:G-protein coupled receptor moody [Aplysia californica]